MGTAANKRILIIAGPNGAGKTTFAHQFLAKEMNGLKFINADEIAAELCPEDPASVAVRAARMMLEQIAEQVSAGTSLIIETTLSGRAYARSILKWQTLGYSVHLYFLSVPAAELSIARVAARVSHGGHHIPEADIRRRFDKGLENFYILYKDLVDFWFLYENANQPPRLIESGDKKHPNG